MMNFMQDYSKGTVRLHFASDEEIAFKVKVFINDSVSEDTCAQRVTTKSSFLKLVI